jgi:hypothetical protein
MRAKEMRTIMIFLLVTNTPPRSYVWLLTKAGKLKRLAPSKAKFPVSNMMPIINPVIAAEARGASLNGR